MTHRYPNDKDVGIFHSIFVDLPKSVVGGIITAYYETKTIGGIAEHCYKEELKKRRIVSRISQLAEEACIDLLDATSRGLTKEDFSTFACKVEIMCGISNYINVQMDTNLAKAKNILGQMESSKYLLTDNQSKKNFRS